MSFHTYNPHTLYMHITCNSLRKLGKHSNQYGVSCMCIYPTSYKTMFVCACQQALTHVISLKHLNECTRFIFTAFSLNWVEMWISPSSTLCLCALSCGNRVCSIVWSVCSDDKKNVWKWDCIRCNHEMHLFL